MNWSKNPGDEHRDRRALRSGLTRRGVLKASAAVVGGSLVGAKRASGSLPALGTTTPANALAPRFYPLPTFVPEIDLAGKVAVITGASRGIGRATGEALSSLGVEVIGTSRDVAAVPNPPAFTMLDLDIADRDSVTAFRQKLKQLLGGSKIDILINNAGRMVVGSILPPSGLGEFRLEKLALAMDTLYRGPIRVTQQLLPLMPKDGYARLLFTISSIAYAVSSDDVTKWMSGYTSGKRALLAYANALRRELSGSSNVRLTTVNPYSVATGIAVHPNPIYTQPVGDNGFTSNPPSSEFDIFLMTLRLATAPGNALPPSLVGEAYAQLLQTNLPPSNVAAGSNQEPYRTQGQNTFVEGALLGENADAAIVYSCQ